MLTDLIGKDRSSAGCASEDFIFINLMHLHFYAIPLSFSYRMICNAT